jgi:hypothetical protein
VRLVLCALLACLACAAPASAQTPFESTGAWIWELSRSDGGNLDRIAARADRAGVETVYVKAADGGRWWPQFSAALVDRLHARGLDVCAWQFLYGRLPLTEAELGARAARLGANCLVLDVEGHYARRYVQAQDFLRRLRNRIGDDYPLGFTSLPYVSWHDTIPYSVFLGPRGAHVNLPQVYWRDIGASVERVFGRTIAENAIYARPLAPIGQLYQAPSPDEIVRFRALAQALGAPGVSFWSWQSAAPSGWAALGREVPVTEVPDGIAAIALRRGDRGDQVAWLQQLLASRAFDLRVTGRFDRATQRALMDLQVEKELAPTGVTGWAEWAHLTQLEPVEVRWRGRGRAARVLDR